MKGRHEVKHYISLEDYFALKTRLPIVMNEDPNALAGGSYFIRSLYFDTPSDKVLNEKRDGVKIRDKYRLRYYNFDTSFIVLEKKTKDGSICTKRSAQVSADEVERLLKGDTLWMNSETRPLVWELFNKMKFEGLFPRTIVDYERDAYIYGPGNVRVTLDHGIRTGINSIDFLNPESPSLPIEENPIVMEIKWDEYLPDIIRDLIQTPRAVVTSFSKYENSRIYDF